jgi:UDP-N-acetylglucosamine--N-acetylmuramyl-(pentapeptide) pyrophosphoryl-undecaprenol N-acetylglucosamine transferase
MQFIFAGGGTGGHVIPALAVARELKGMGHDCLFAGTRTGMEAKLAPEAGFPIHFITIGGLNRVGLARKAKTLYELPLATLAMAGELGRVRPAAVFSMGGYAAGPVMIAAALRGVPMVLMEPNAVPGLTNRRMGRYAARALVSFEETARWFPPGKAEVTGVPVRPEFFSLAPKPLGETLTVLITGGSRGSERLNKAARESWPLLREAGLPVCLIHQTGPRMHAELAREFAATGLAGEVTAFIDDMPGAFARADLVVCRSGASAVAEIAAAGKPAILVPFPFAADDHQRKNAEALARAGAARLVLDAEMTGARLFEEIAKLDPQGLENMGRAARALARPDAARRAAEVLVRMARKKD